MSGNDLHHANVVLNVLHDNRAGSDGIRNLIHHHLPNSTSNDYLIAKYDLDRSPLITLTGRFAEKKELVISYLRHADPRAPWGKIDDDIMILKLADLPRRRTGRLLLFSVEFVMDLLVQIFPEERITPAERTTLLQMLCGLSLKDSAEVSTVSYETKKTQMRSLFLKSNTNSQQALSNFIITHLILEMSSSNSREVMNAESDEAFFYYADHYMGSYVRASVIQQPGGKRFRVIELGDPAGYPVVCLHHLGLLNFSSEEIKAITEQHIRLICPLRHGALGPADKRISTHEHQEHAMAGIDLAVSLTGQRKATIITLLSSCLYGIKYLDTYTEKVARLIFFAAPYSPHTQKQSRSPVKKSLHQLATNHEEALESTLSILLQNASVPERLRNVIRNSHNNGEADRIAIDALFEDPTQVEAMQHRLINSYQSIAQDLQAQANINWQQLYDNDHNAEIHFVHGDSDKLIPIDTIEALQQQKSSYHIHRIQGAGNWIFGQFTHQTFSAVRDICSYTNPAQASRT